MTDSEYLEMPWSIEDTIENLNEIKEMLKSKLVNANMDGKAESDVKELEFDFDRAIQALEEVEQYRAIGTVEEVKALKDDFWKLNEMCRHYSAIGTVEELKAIKQWKADIIESFSKYDVNSVEELRASVIDKFMEAFLTKAMEASEKAIFDGGLVCDVLTLDCASDMVLEIALDMKGEKE